LTSATGIAYFVMAAVPVWIPENIANAVEITNYALSVSTTTLSTIIIVTRILLVSRMPGASKKSRLAAEMIAESAALYTISALIYIGMIPSACFDYTPYASIFFIYMAVCSPSHSCHSAIALIALAYNRTLLQLLSCSV
jgi:hypothetical protein